MADGNTISGVFAFIAQTRQLYPQTASDIRTRQQSIDDINTHISKLYEYSNTLINRAQALLDELSRVRSQIYSEENRLMQLRSMEGQSSSENDREDNQLRNEIRQREQTIAALEQHRDRLDQAYSNTMAVYDEVKGKIATLSDTAAQLKSDLHAKKGKCAAVASKLIEEANVLHSEAQSVQTQKSAFSSIASMRFSASASHAAANRSAREQELTRHENEARTQAQLYQELADGLISPDTAQHRQVIAQRLSGTSNPHARSLYQKHASSVQFENNNFSGTAFYSPSTGKISLHAGVDAQNPKGAGTTYFHEVGHMIDHKSGVGGSWLSSDPQYGAALKADAESYISGVMADRNCSRQQAYEIISDEITNTEYHSISDLFGSMTNCECQGIWGHRREYWAGDPQAFHKEAFAHMFEASIGSVEKQQKFRTYFPRAYSVFESMIRRV